MKNIKKYEKKYYFAYIFNKKIKLIIILELKKSEYLKDNNIRTFLDERTESVGKKIRDNTVQKIPYILTIGDKEVKSKNLAIRDNKGKVKFDVKVDDFIKDISTIITKKKA